MQKRSVFRPPEGRRLLLSVLLLLLLILTAAGPVRADPDQGGQGSGGAGGSTSPVDQWVKGQVQNLPKDKVESYWDQLMKEYGGFFRTVRHLR